MRGYIIRLWMGININCYIICADYLHYEFIYWTGKLRRI